MYGADEYGLQRRILLVPGLLGGAISLLLLVDALNYARSRDHAAQAFKQTVLYRFQLYGSLAAVMFSIVGPLLGAAQGYVGCDGPTIPTILDSSATPVETTACTVNRSSIYFTMIVLNLLVVNIRAVRNNLTASLQQTSFNDHTDKLSVLAAVIPLTLAAAMYAIDKLDSRSPDFQGQIARWTIQCGPRLSPAAELLLVHLPICISCAGITILAVQTSRVAGSTFETLTSLMGDTVSQQMTDSLRNLKNLALALSILGVVCAVLGIAYSAVVLLVVPRLTHSSDEFKDYLMCQNYRSASERHNLLTTVDNCTHLAANLGYWRDGKEVDLPASQLSLVQRPPPAVVGIMLAVPATVPLLFSLFYLTFMLRRLTSAKALREQTKLKATSALKLTSARNMVSSSSSAAVAPSTAHE
jgi:hypothetical protein